LIDQAAFDRFRDTLAALPLKPRYEKSDLLIDSFLLFKDRGLDVYYAPFHYLNRAARVVLVGITPGFTQAELAFRTARSWLDRGLSDEELFHRIETTASFGGPMRRNLVGMLNNIDLQGHLALTSCDKLFEQGSRLVHFTSVVSAPIFKNGENYNGTSPRLLDVPSLKDWVLNNLTEEIDALPSALVIPLGKVADEAMTFLKQLGKIDAGRCLEHFPHPSPASGRRKPLFAAGQQNWKEQIRKWFEKDRK